MKYSSKHRPADAWDSAPLKKGELVLVLGGGVSGDGTPAPRRERSPEPVAPCHWTITEAVPLAWSWFLRGHILPWE